MERLGRKESLKALISLFGVPYCEGFADTGFRVSLWDGSIIDSKGNRTGNFKGGYQIMAPGMKRIGYVDVYGRIYSADTRQMTNYRIGGPTRNMVLYVSGQARRGTKKAA